MQHFMCAKCFTAIFINLHNPWKVTMLLHLFYKQDRQKKKKNSQIKWQKGREIKTLILRLGPITCAMSLQ